ncbi:hypothetical protein [Moorena sp. SIO1F2]|nr:hypothetical protein [Moorena sp. SIO1F2]
MRYTRFFPDSRFPIPDSRFPIPDSRFPKIQNLCTSPILEML